MLTFKDVNLLRGHKRLLESANVSLEFGYRTGLIGRNGSGKTSLFQLILGYLREDQGDVVFNVDKNSIAYLEQALPHSEESAIDYVKAGDKRWALIQARLAQAEYDEDGMKIAECYTDLQAIDGFTLEGRVSQILQGLGFDSAVFKNAVSTFSGGWQMRLQLARALVAPADLLLLDEPTNHLDIEAIVWLETWLQQRRGSMLIISHDRDFLDNVCTHTLHLSHRKLYLYTGNYSSFSKQLQARLEREANVTSKISRQRAHLQSYIDRFRYKASKAKQAQSRIKAIEKLAMSPGLQQESSFSFQFLPCETLSDPIIKIDGDVGYDNHVILKKIGMNINHDDRIAFLGKNGCGKSTLIKTIAGDLSLLRGEITCHPKLKIGYFSQHQLDTLNYDITPYEHIQLLDKKLGEAEIRHYLGGFGFSGDSVFNQVGHFSGGEKSRLALAILIYERPNLLLLDEPTNHLDLQMREALIIALQSYAGAVVLVSHDRHFVKCVADQLYLISKNNFQKFEGDLEDYQQLLFTVKDAPSSQDFSAKISSPKAVIMSRQPEKERKKLESKMEIIKDKIKTIEQDLEDQTLYCVDNQPKLSSVLMQHQNLKQELLELEELWLNL